MAGPIESAVCKRDFGEARFQIAVKLAGMMDATNDKRYAPMTANRLLDCLDAMESKSGKAKPKTEVTTFEVIANRRAERRKAAEG